MATITISIGTGVSSFTYAYVNLSGTRIPSSGTQSSSSSMTFTAADHVWIATVTAASGYANPTGTGTYYDSDTYELTASKLYSLTLNNTTGGSVAGGGNKAEGSSVTISASASTGYSFSGWYSSAGKKVSVANPYTFTMPSNNLTLTGKFTAIQYKVTYNGNGGTPSATSQSGTYGTTLTGTATRQGYAFAGWWTASSGGTQRTSIVATETVYAHWADIYTVSYDAQGGTVVPNAQSGVAGTALSYTVSRTGYTFQGWYTGTGGSGTQRTTIVKTETLYAYWTINSYTVTYNGNGGTVTSSATQTANYGTALTGTATRGGYIFAGWWTASSGGEQRTTIVQQETLYAHWTAQTQYSHKIVYRRNAGESTETTYTDSWTDYSSTTTRATVGLAALPSTWPRTDFTLDGWGTNRSEKEYNIGARVSVGTTTVTLYSIWTEKKYAVSTTTGLNVTAITPSYVASVGQGTGQSFTAAIKSAGWGAWITPGETGKQYNQQTYYTYAFNTWSVDKTSGVDNGTFSSTTSNPTTFYPSHAATISANAKATGGAVHYTVSVKYSPGAGSGTMEDSMSEPFYTPPTGQDVYDVTLRTCTFTPPTGMKFDHWETSTGATASGTKVSIFYNTVLTAKYRGKYHHKVTYYRLPIPILPGDTFSKPDEYTTSQTQTYKVQSFPSTWALPEHMSFTGWNTQSDGSGTPYSPDNDISVGTTEIILYAQYKFIEFNFTTKCGNGIESITPSSGAIVEGESAKLVAVKKSASAGNWTEGTNNGYDVRTVTDYGTVRWSSTDTGSYFSPTTGTIVNYYPSTDSTVTAAADDASYKEYKYHIIYNKGTGSGDPMKQRDSEVSRSSTDPKTCIIDDCAFTPPSHYHFVHWKDQNNNTYTPTVEGTLLYNVTLTAIYEEDTKYPLDIGIIPAGSGTVTGGSSGNYYADTVHTLTAKDSDDYWFTKWVNEDGETSLSPTYSFTQGTKARIANAYFTTYTVTFNGSGGTSSIESMIGKAGKPITATATRENYDWTGWYTLGGTKRTEIVQTETLYAHWLYRPNVIVHISPLNSGNVTGTGRYSQGEEVTLTAIPNQNYKFVKWTTLEGVELTTANPYIFTISNTDVEIAAIFQLNEYKLSSEYDSNIFKSVTIDPTTVSYGSSANISANLKDNTSEYTKTEGYQQKKGIETTYAFTQWAKKTTSMYGEFGDATKASTTFTPSGNTMSIVLLPSGTKTQKTAWKWIIEYDFNYTGAATEYYDTDPYISETQPSRETVSINHKITRDDPTRTGYTFIGWYNNGVGPYKKDSELSCKYGTKLKARWKKNTLKKFNWTEDDATLIKKDQPVSNLKATMWNEFIDTIIAIAEAQDVTVQVDLLNAQKVVDFEDPTDKTITAYRFTTIRNEIAKLRGGGSVTSGKTQKEIVLAIYFANTEGSTFTTKSIKDALNNAFDNI